MWATILLLTAACVHVHTSIYSAYEFECTCGIGSHLPPCFWGEVSFLLVRHISRLSGPQASCTVFMSPGIRPLGITEPTTAFDSWGSRDSNSGHQVCTRNTVMDPVVLLDPNCSVKLWDYRKTLQLFGYLSIIVLFSFTIYNGCFNIASFLAFGPLTF